MTFRIKRTKQTHNHLHQEISINRSNSIDLCYENKFITDDDEDDDQKECNTIREPNKIYFNDRIQQTGDVGRFINYYEILARLGVKKNDLFFLLDPNHHCLTACSTFILRLSTHAGFTLKEASKVLHPSPEIDGTPCHQLAKDTLRRKKLHQEEQRLREEEEARKKQAAIAAETHRKFAEWRAKMCTRGRILYDGVHDGMLCRIGVTVPLDSQSKLELLVPCVVQEVCSETRPYDPLRLKPHSSSSSSSSLSSSSSSSSSDNSFSISRLRSFMVRPLLSKTTLPKELAQQRSDVLHIYTVLTNATCLGLRPTSRDDPEQWLSQRQQMTHAFWRHVLPQILDPNWLRIEFFSADRTQQQEIDIQKTYSGRYHRLDDPLLYGQWKLLCCGVNLTARGIQLSSMEFASPLWYSVQFHCTPQDTEQESYRHFYTMSLEPTLCTTTNELKTSFASLVMGDSARNTPPYPSLDSVFLPPSREPLVFVPRSFMLDILSLHDHNRSIITKVILLLIIEYASIIPVDSPESYATLRCV